LQLLTVPDQHKQKSAGSSESASLNPMLCCVYVCAQAQLEEVLFSIIREKGFDEAHIDCYRMVTQFYQSRQPLCIIICGAAWTGVGWAWQESCMGMAEDCYAQHRCGGFRA
jgi:hypothetical protein